MKLSAEHWWNITCRGDPKCGKTEVIGGKPCRSSTWVTTQLTWISPVLNTGLRCERPVTDSLSPVQRLKTTVNLIMYKDAVGIAARTLCV